MKPAVIAVMFSLLASVPAHADLLEQYLNNDQTPTRGQVSYGFGANVPAPYAPNAGGNVIDLSGGVQAGGSCGGFNLGASLKSVFNLEAADQYVQGLASAALSSAPMLLTCYASQTLCDITKFFRTNANAILSMRAGQCQQVEALAEKTGTSLRNNAIKKCIDEHRANGDDLDTAMSACGNIQPDTTIPGSTQQVAEYSISDAVAKAGSSDPDVQNFIKGIIGDVRFSGSAGIYTAGSTQYGMETQVSNYTNAFYNATQGVGEQFVSNRQCPDAHTLNLISTPGTPISCLTLTRLSTLDPDTRDNFYRQYASVAAINTLLYKMEDALEALEKAKAAAQDKDTIAKLEDGMNDMERRYNIMEKRLALQKDYLVPMMQTLMQQQAPYRAPDVTQPQVDIQAPVSKQ